MKAWLDEGTADLQPEDSPVHLFTSVTLSVSLSHTHSLTHSPTHLSIHSLTPSLPQQPVHAVLHQRLEELHHGRLLPDAQLVGAQHTARAGAASVAVHTDLRPRHRVACSGTVRRGEGREGQNQLSTTRLLKRMMAPDLAQKRPVTLKVHTPCRRIFICCAWG